MQSAEGILVQDEEICVYFLKTKHKLKMQNKWTYQNTVIHLITFPSAIDEKVKCFIQTLVTNLAMYLE